MIVSNSIKSPFKLVCSFPDVKEKDFFEAYRKKDYSNPSIQTVLKSPQCYPKLKYYIAHLCIKLKLHMPELASEIDEVKNYPDYFIHPDCYLALALAGRILFPLHQINEFLKIEEQPYVVEKLIEFGFDVNEPCKLFSVDKPYHMGVDYDCLDYTPIYYANYLTVPILIKHGAKVHYTGQDYQPIDQVVYYLQDKKCTLDLKQLLITHYKILYEAGAEPSQRRENQ